MSEVHINLRSNNAVREDLGIGPAFLSLSERAPAVVLSEVIVELTDSSYPNTFAYKEFVLFQQRRKKGNIYSEILRKKNQKSTR